jgi:hypothetical protein
MEEYFSKLLKVHRFNGVKQTEIHAFEALVPKASFLRLGVKT